MSARTEGHGFEDLDEEYEFELFEQLPVQAQNDVKDVAQAIMDTYDGMPPDFARPAANLIRREQREVFDRVLNLRREMEAIEDFVDEALQARGYVVSHVRGQEAIEEAVDEGYVVGYIDQNNAQALDGLDQNNVRQPIFAKGKGKGKGFEPFSGKGRRLD